MSTTNFAHFYEHVRRVLFALRHDLKSGGSIDMHIAFALVSLNNYRLAFPSPTRVVAQDLQKVRLNQALQIAICHYEQPDVVASVGEDQARIMREQWFFLLRELTSP